MIPDELNTTLIYLVLKVHKLESIQQFRPIGLCNTLYKTITKILVLRIKPFLDDLIHLFQESFIPGRKASDNIILAQKVIHTISTSSSKKGLMAVTIDLEKAFDRLEWGFIRHILNFFNFPRAWIDLIMSCITTASLSIPVNVIESVENDLGIRACRDFGKYLGVPIVTNKKNSITFNFIIEKLCSKLANWKVASLSLIGRLTLITTVTTTIPSHAMQCIIISVKVCKEIDKINRNFLWGETNQKKKKASSTGRQSQSRSAIEDLESNPVGIETKRSLQSASGISTPIRMNYMLACSLTNTCKKRTITNVNLSPGPACTQLRVFVTRARNGSLGTAPPSTFGMTTGWGMALFETTFRDR
ncbi:hypothetical protein SO802_026102 [Lithocarpus litseifolius]|uniref:Reverse transcriptase domain-containing protein n=1 Tax=Lithocarpus litseifolius TaxID=425828 RepID=A0AAW2C0I4_9ROSI